MRHTRKRGVVAALLAAAVALPALADDKITGAGATFPYPLYAKWAEQYRKEKGIGLNYQSIGSGGGIKQIKAGTVDFGASDKPLERQELDSSQLVQFPTVMGGVVPVVNLQAVKPGELKLTGEVLANVYLGKITKWNDPAIAQLNPGVQLPDKNINVVHRSDGSGTTFIFTNYLSKVSPQWKERVGSDSSVKWPVGVGGKGNEGVSSYVQRIDGSIGYVEYAYAQQNQLKHAIMRNRDGQFVEPGVESFQAAASGATWKPEDGFYTILTDQPGANSWPITGATFILVRRQARSEQDRQQVLQFFDWAFEQGDRAAIELDYVPLPDSVVRMVKDHWKQFGNGNSRSGI